MREDHRKNQNKRNNKNMVRRIHIQTIRNKDKEVAMKYQIWNSKETNTVELKFTDIDRSVDKTKFNINEDGTDDEFLKLSQDLRSVSRQKCNSHNL